MKAVHYTKVQENSKRQKRVWLEGLKLSDAGFNKGVKYTRDVEFEISIKYGLFCERYGKVLVEKYFSDNGIYLLDLDDQDLYVKVSKDLKSI